MVWRGGLAVVLVAACMWAAGCKGTQIAGTSVENTPDNREVADAVEGYRRAMETRNVDNILRLCSAEYFEDGGTSDPSDDYSYSGLGQHLKTDLERVQALRLSVRLLRVEVDGDRAMADYRFQVRSLVSFPSGDQWITRTDDNRLTFRRESMRWRIVAGL